MGICLEQLKCLCVLAASVWVESQKVCGTPIVLLSENELPRHSYRQFGEALHVLFD